MATKNIYNKKIYTKTNISLVNCFQFFSFLFKEKFHQTIFFIKKKFTKQVCDEKRIKKVNKIQKKKAKKKSNCDNTKKKSNCDKTQKLDLQQNPNLKKTKKIKL